MISGIQQTGIGVTDVIMARNWYSRYLGMDIEVFNDSSTADLMLKYTNNEKCSRHAILAVNIRGGGGLEIWQHKGHIPAIPGFEIQLGDFGIFAVKIKTQNIISAFEFFKSHDINVLGDIYDFESLKHFFLKDPFGNIFQVVESDDNFTWSKHSNGGVYGCIIGVSDINKAKLLYSNILGYDRVIYEREGVFDDLAGLPGGKNDFHRILLSPSLPRKGAFSEFLGNSQIELVKVNTRKPSKIFQNRIWGDPGFIHLCFDVNHIDELREECRDKGYPFTVDTGKGFDMGDASGHFAYIEDNDGTLIEFVETHKLPIIKKIGWYYNLKDRKSNRPLPRWMIKTLKFNRFREKN